MAGQKARIDKDSKDYLSKDARPDAEAQTAYDSQKDLEGTSLDADRNGNGPDVFSGGTKKDRSRRADQITAGTTGIGDTGTGLEKMESSPFAGVLRKRFSSILESENPGTASAPATSDSPSLGMYSVNNTDFRQQKIDVRNILEGIALQAAESFELLDENSNVPDPIINDLQTTAKAVSKIYEYATKSMTPTDGDAADTSSVPKETPQGKPGMNEEAEELDELSRKTLGSYGSKALRAGLKGDEKSEKRFKGANLASAKLYPRQYEKSPLKAKVPATNEEVEELDEKLIGNQDKIDANKNGKLDAHDFKLLRSKKTMKEAVDIVFAEILRGKLDADN